MGLLTPSGSGEFQPLGSCPYSCMIPCRVLRQTHAVWTLHLAAQSSQVLISVCIFWLLECGERLGSGAAVCCKGKAGFIAILIDPAQG